ncbi:MAG: tetratricopeptide repeat protein [Candidatus Limnocylindrales bacterium]
MTDDLYERYKEALRVGHVAVLRGALQDAIEAYRDAAAIAPSRALPHTSLGGVLLRLGHLEEALVEYAAAVARAPHDEGALLGQAEALTIAGQRVDAALALDHVAEIQAAAGRLPEAADTVRRALELEDSPERARCQRGLLREIRLSAGDHAAEQLLARALRLRDEPVGDALATARSATAAAPIAGPSAQAAESVVADERPERLAPATAEVAAESAPEPVDVAVVRPAAELEWPKEDRKPQPAARPVAGPAPVAEPVAIEPVPEAEPVAAAASQGEVPAVGVMVGASDTIDMTGTIDETHQPTGDQLLAAAEAADMAGDSGTLRSLLLGTARAYAREGRFEAGLDAAHRLLQRDPGDVDAHLVLVELYVARDWNGLAAEKLVLLGRLADLDNDEETRQRLCAVASRVFPDDEHLGALCA